MPWALLLDLRVILGAALIATAIYAKVQTVRMEQAKAEYAQFRADVESEAAKAKVAAARQEAQQAKNAQEVLSDLQTRLDAATSRYARLRARSSGDSVPALSAAATSLGSCPGDAGKPDAAARFLERTETGVIAFTERFDKELAKYVKLWQLQQKNATAP